jgi:hypothetical protein
VVAPVEHFAWPMSRAFCDYLSRLQEILRQRVLLPPFGSGVSDLARDNLDLRMAASPPSIEGAL